MLARLEKLISELDGLVDDIEERDSELGLLASEVWEALRDIAGRLKEKEAQTAAANILEPIAAD